MDPIEGNFKGVRNADIYHISSEDKSLKIYDGLYHEVFNEPECDCVLEDVEDWLESHLTE